MQYNPHPTRVYAGMGGGCPVGAWAPSIHSSKHELHAPAVHVVHRAPGGEWEETMNRGLMHAEVSRIGRGMHT